MPDQDHSFVLASRILTHINMSMPCITALFKLWTHINWLSLKQLKEWCIEQFIPQIYFLLQAELRVYENVACSNIRPLKQIESVLIIKKMKCKNFQSL